MRAVAGEGEEEGSGEGGGEGRATMVFFLDDCREYQGEGNDGDACELVDREGSVTKTC